MGERSRLQNSFFNMVSGFFSRMIGMITSFIIRTVFIRCLTSEYLGINGLYSSILSMLSLAELGFGTAMVYSMYHPLANKDTEKLNQLMILYRRVYVIIGTVILIIGLGLTPFLDYLIKDAPNISGLKIYYLLFLLNSVVSYWFFAYRNSLLQADQKAYILTNYMSAFNIIKTKAQIILLIAFHSYTIYLITQILCTIGQNICIALKVDQLYPFIKKEPKNKLPNSERNKIFKDVKALMLSKVSHVVLNSTDNIIISAFVGINWVGLLSNFILITDAITSILCQVTGALTASLGNFFAKENSDEGYKIFRKIEFLNFWLYGFSMIALIVLLNPFVSLWLGEEFLLSEGTVLALSINFFVAGFMNTLWTFRSTLGLFTQGQYRPLIVAGLNIVISIGLSYICGVAGVLAGTFISRACVNLWYDPWLIHRKGFGKSVRSFFLNYIFKIILLVIMTMILKYVSLMILGTNITIKSFIILLFIVGTVPNIVFAIIFFKTDEFRYFYQLIFRYVLKKKR